MIRPNNGSPLFSFPKYWLILCLLLLPARLLAQADSTTWLAWPPPYYSFVKYEENDILKRNRIDSFLNKLVVLKHTHKGKVTIVHIGDSHLQADGITSILRNGLQDFFGDAGRGLVFPYQLANTNGPHDLKSWSNTTWKNGRLAGSEKQPKAGICGYGIHATSKNAAINIRLTDYIGKQEYFNRMVFFLSGEGADYRIADTNIKADLVLTAHASNEDTASLIVSTDSLITGFEISRTLATAEGEYSFYGVSLEKKDSSGILYHTIGVNGARYDQFNKDELFRKQLYSLHGDLFIISLGTNEAQNQYINEQTIMAACDTLVQTIRKVAPKAEVIITTPPGSYFKAKKPNPSVQSVSNAFKKYCNARDISCWDLFAITGGLAGTPSWKKYNLISHDLIHYNNNGYQLQGLLLLNAIAKAYNGYEKAHPYHPPKPPAPKPAAANKAKESHEPAKASPPIVKKTAPEKTEKNNAPNTTTQKKASNIKVEYSE